MFFSAKATTVPKGLKQDILESSKKSEIKRRIQELTELNDQVAKAVVEAQAASTELIERVNLDLKSVKRSLRPLLSCMRDGALVINHRGVITHINQVAAHLFHFDEAKLVGTNFVEMFKTADVKITSGHKFDANFFNDLNAKLLTEIQQAQLAREPFDLSCAEALKLFRDDSITAKIPCYCVDCDCTESTVLCTFGLLDSEPTSINDLLYIFVMKKSAPNGVERRKE